MPQPRNAPEERTNVTPLPLHSEQRLSRRIIAAGIVLVAAALFALGLTLGLLLSQDDEAEEPPATDIPPTATRFVVSEFITPLATSTATNAPAPTLTATRITGSFTRTLTFTFEPPTSLPATNTASPTHTASFTFTPTATSTASATATATLPPTLTLTPLPPSPVPPSATLPGPTIAFPNGQRVLFYYDDYSFYVWNPNEASLSAAPFSFEGINASGIPNGKSFDGDNWAQFYEILESSRCLAIETTQAPTLLRPTQCTFYNAIVTPQRTSRLVFWTSNSGSTLFRVLWNDVEVGRCEVGAGECTVFLP